MSISVINIYIIRQHTPFCFSAIGYFRDSYMMLLFSYMNCNIGAPLISEISIVWSDLNFPLPTMTVTAPDFAWRSSRHSKKCDHTWYAFSWALLFCLRFAYVIRFFPNMYWKSERSCIYREPIFMSKWVQLSNGFFWSLDRGFSFSIRTINGLTMPQDWSIKSRRISEILAAAHKPLHQFLWILPWSVFLMLSYGWIP